MSRKRLGRIDPAAAAIAREAAESAGGVQNGTAQNGSGQSGTPRRAGLSAPPIAQMAAGVGQEIDAEIRRLRAETHALSAKGAAFDAAEAEGRMIHAIPLEQIDPAHMLRDRRALDRTGEDWGALKASLTSRGQQVPVDLVDLGEGAAPRYGLVTGLRRVTALGELRQETGDARFAHVLALVRPALAAPDKLIAMIEENEIRAGISFYERGRIAVMAAEAGIYPDADAAVDALFASSIRNRRYKIRCFVTIYQALGAHLRHPEAIGERLGIALAKALREGAVAHVVAALERAGEREADADADAEAALLTALVKDHKGRNKPPADPAPDQADPLKSVWTGARGHRVSARTRPETRRATKQATGQGAGQGAGQRSGRVTIEIEGLAGVDAPTLDRLTAWLGQQVERESEG